MHSCFIAYELAGTLKNPGGIQVEEDVQLADKGLINARVSDALALTAGGKLAKSGTRKEGESDIVFHTTREMLNGLRGITGAPKLSRDQATKVMEAFWHGKTSTSAIEKLLPDQTFPCMPQQNRAPGRPTAGGRPGSAPGRRR